MDTFQVGINVNTSGSLPAVRELSSAVSSVSKQFETAEGAASKAMQQGMAWGNGLTKATNSVTTKLNTATAKVTEFGKKQAEAFGKTAPVVAMGKRVDAVRASMTSAVTATKSFGKGFLETAPGVEKLTSLLVSATQKVEAFRKKSAEAAKQATTGAGAKEKKGMGAIGFGLVAGGAAAVASMGVTAVVGGIGAVAHAAEEFQATSRSLSKSFGLTGKDASDFADQLDAMSDNSMMSNEALLGGFKELSAAGLDARSATLALAAASDIGVSVGESQGAAFTEAISKMAKMGEVSSRTLMAMQATGFSATELGSALGLGDGIKTFDELNKKVDQTSMSVGKAASGLVALSTKKYSTDGAAGGAAKAAAAASMSKQFDVLTGNIVEMFNKIDFSPLITALNKVNKFFDDPKVGAFVGVIKAAFGGLITQVVDGAGKMFAFFEELAGPKPMEKFGGVIRLFNALKPVVGILFSTLFSIAKVVAPALLAAFDAIAGAVGGLIELLTPLIEKFSKVAEMVAGGWAKGLGGATSLIKGITKKVFGEAPKAAEAVLEINSPSRVFDRIAGHTVAGFTNRIDAGASKASDSAGAMANAAVEGGTSGAKALGSSVGSGGGNTFNVSVTVNGAGGDADEVGDSVAAKLRAELARMFGDMSLSQGAMA